MLGTMKRLWILLCAKSNRRSLILLLCVCFVGAIFYSGVLTTKPRKSRTVVVKRVLQQNNNKGGVQPSTQDDTPNGQYTNVKLVYHDPDPKYKITTFEKMEPNCYGDACELNRQRQPIDVTPIKRSQCIPISKCVTINIKTRHRYLEVKEFIDSFHKYFPALRVVVADEFNPKYDESEFSKFVGESPLITYVQSKPGVGYGRKLAAMLSETPYILVADDDYMFSPKTNITKLVEVLENTDADIAAGTTDDTFPFAGAVRVSTEEGKTSLSLYPGVYYNVIPNFRNCYQADIVKTFFLAKKDFILRGGSWDVNRPFYEHEDFFFQMRKSRIKIAHCDDVIVRHVARTRDLANLRHNFFDEMKVKLLEKWQLDDYFSCTVPMTYLDEESCPIAKRHHFH